MYLYDGNMTTDFHCYGLLWVELDKLINTNNIIKRYDNQYTTSKKKSINKSMSFNYSLYICMLTTMLNCISH